MSRYPQLTELYASLVKALMEEVRGTKDLGVLIRRQDEARRLLQRELADRFLEAEEQGDPARLARRVAQFFLDYTPLAADPFHAEVLFLLEGWEARGGELRVPAQNLREVLEQVQDSERLRRHALPGEPVRGRGDLSKLLEAWPTRPTKGMKDLHRRALAEWSKTEEHLGSRRKARVVEVAMELALGTSWERHHSWREALLEALVRWEPGNAELHFQLGRHYKAYGEIGRARRSVRRAVELEPREVESLALLAGLLEFSLRPKEALHVYEKILRRGSEGPRSGHEGQIRSERVTRARAMGRDRQARTKGRRTMTGSFQVAEVSRGRSRMAAHEGVARLRLLLDDVAGALDALVHASRERSSKSRALRQLWGLAAMAGAGPLEELLSRELEALGGLHAEPPPPWPGWQKAPTSRLRDLLEARVLPRLVDPSTESEAEDDPSHRP